MSNPPPTHSLRINAERLHQRLIDLGAIGALDGGGVCRLALTPEDQLGRECVVEWMHQLGLKVTCDAIGNVVGVRSGQDAQAAPVMTGSHIDTVRTGGLYDGNLGVLAGLEVVQVLNEHNIRTRRPLAVAFFTNEEGARFAPDMMGSLVFAGDMTVEAARAVVGIDGKTVGECLDAIGYAGTVNCGQTPVHAFVELHIEQGPVLESQGVTIGAVEQVQGISWTQYTITGKSNHAGTTPMSMRQDAGFAAAAIAMHARQIATTMGGDQVATVGRIEIKPNLVNVVANHALLTVDLRNTCESSLQHAETQMQDFITQLQKDEQVTITQRSLARFEPVAFDASIVKQVGEVSQRLGLSCQRMPSGAGHDAQMLARLCKAGMIFIPSVNGISHNVKEFTEATDVEAGANVLLQLLVDLSSEPS